MNHPYLFTSFPRWPEPQPEHRPRTLAFHYEGREQRRARERAQKREAARRSAHTE